MSREGRPELRRAALLIEHGQLEAAASFVQQFLGNHPKDADAWFLAGDIARRRGTPSEAEPLFAHAVELAPEFEAAQFHHANVLLEIGKPEEALLRAEQLLQARPKNPVFRALKAMALELTDDHGAAALLWHEVVQEGAPAEFCVRYSHVLRVLGRREDSIAACREALARDPAYGRAWWALAQLTTFRFSDGDVIEMEALAAHPEIDNENRIPILFALGKAYGQRKRYEKSFAAYARGNALKRLSIRHDPNVLTAYVARCKAVFTPAFFRAREGHGCATRAPIFLVGMTRAGSTLVEQILSSHSQVEGTRELFNLGAIAGGLQRARGANSLSRHAGNNGRGHVQPVWRAVPGNCARPPETRPAAFHRQDGKQFRASGLLHLILPNAKIVDVRRHPLACGWSNFSQLYANGQNETYRLSDFGQLYRDYAESDGAFRQRVAGTGVPLVL